MRFMPPIAVAIPLFLMVRAIGLQDSYPGLILPYVAFSLPLVVWILIGFFDEIPQEIDEAAMIDGATRIQALWRVILPIVRPGMVTAALFGALFTWNEFLVALYVIDSAPVPDDLARRRDAGQRAAADRLEHRRRGRHRHRRAHPDLLAFRAALHRARPDRWSRQMNKRR